MAKQKNTYTLTDVTHNGAIKHVTNIHNTNIQMNQNIWEMIKILNKNELYGFNLEAKVGTNKTLITLRHEDEKLLDEAKELLRDFYKKSDFLFFTKVIEKKSSKTMWIILAISILLILFARLFWGLYEKELIFTSNDNASFTSKATEELSNAPTVIQEIEINIKKLNSLRETFSEQNNSMNDKAMHAMEITTSVISSLVSEEEKKKYSTQNLVKSFKGKSGIRFVAKDGNLSRDFNATIKELHAYGKKFISDGHISLAIQSFDRALEQNTTQFNQDNKLLLLASQGELYEKLNKPKEAEKSYSEMLKISGNLAKDNFKKYGLNEAFVNAKLATLYGDLNQTNLESKALKNAETLYHNIIFEFRKKSKDNKVDQARLAWALNFMVSFYEKNHKDPLLIMKLREEIVNIYKKLSKKNPKDFALKYYKSINSLGKSYLLIHKLDLAYKAYSNSLNVAKKVLKKPQYQALSLRALAMVQIKKKSLKLAETYYNNALKIYRKSRKKYKFELLELRSSLAYLEIRKGNFKLAEQQYKQIVLSYKKINEKEPLKYNLQISKNLNELASLYLLNTKEPIKAKVKLIEAIYFAKNVKKTERKEAKELLMRSYQKLMYLSLLQTIKSLSSL